MWPSRLWLSVKAVQGEPITAALGQYGPYVKHEKTYANLPNWEDLFTVGLNHAVTLIADKVAGKSGRFQRQKEVLKELEPRISSIATAQALAFSPPALPGSTGGR